LKRRKTQNAAEFSELEASHQSDDIEIVEAQEQNNGTTENGGIDENAMDVDEGAAPNPVLMNTNAQTDQLCLEILPSNNIPPHEAVFVNDPKLSDLRVSFMEF
jgi:hypothetical protein